MKLNVGMLVIPVVLVLVLSGCSPKYTDIVVLEVGKNRVTLGEYENFYVRNSGGWEIAKQSSQEERERFLDLLTNYKLKLLDAYERNFVNDSEIVNELREYRGSLASTYLLEQELTEPGVKKLYDRKREEIRAQHILIRIQGASSEDTQKAYTKTMGLIQRIKTGESFDTLALKFSDSPTTSKDYGDLYYFTGGALTGIFEDAAYSLQKGETNATPILTPFGYITIKVTDRQPSKGSLKVRHIMARFHSNPPDSADSASAYARIRVVQDSLKRGGDFSKVAMQFSEDPGSSSQGGDLGWFERRRFVQPFDEAAFRLNVGQVSDVVRTPFGYHILRCDSVKPLPPYSAVREDLKRLYQQTRYNDDYNTYIAKLKKKYYYSFNSETFNSLMTYLDSLKTTSDSGWYDTVPSDLRARALMTINQYGITVDSLINVLENRPEHRNTALRKNEVKSKLVRIAESYLLQVESLGLEERDQKFGALMKEYQDGIVLYKAEQLEVWNKTTVTDSALREYYEQNKSQFTFPERLDIREIYLESDTLAVLVYDSLEQGADFEELAARHNDDPDLKASKGARNKVSVDTDEVTEYAKAMSIGEISEPFELEGGGWAIVKLLAKEPARQKTYEEAGAEVSNAFQEYEAKRLERLWLEKVKEKHPVKQYKEHLKHAFTKSQPAR
ncbi:MAG: peptidylprolyl isomerase [Ignavibacteriae bacterium]|nr:peptidylprolyl isomerase [Ignavibacteriota bacterium]